VIWRGSSSRRRVFDTTSASRLCPLGVFRQTYRSASTMRDDKPAEIGGEEMGLWGAAFLCGLFSLGAWFWNVHGPSLWPAALVVNAGPKSDTSAG